MVMNQTEDSQNPVTELAYPADQTQRKPERIPPLEPGFIGQKQLLARLPISRRTLYNWRRAGKIPSVRIGGRRILFHWPSVEAALLRHQRGGSP